MKLKQIFYHFTLLVQRVPLLLSVVSFCFLTDSFWSQRAVIICVISAILLLSCAIYGGVKCKRHLHRYLDLRSKNEMADSQEKLTTLGMLIIQQLPKQITVSNDYPNNIIAIPLNVDIQTQCHNQ